MATPHGGSILVNVNGNATLTVSITNAATSQVATNFTVGGSAQTFPVNITATTQFDVPVDGNYIVSVLQNNIQVASNLGTTVTVPLQFGELFSCTPTLSPQQSSEALLALLGNEFSARNVFTNYAPSSASTYTTTAQTSAALDTTNLTTTVVAPPSGSVVVSLTGNASVTAGTGTYYWTLHNASGGAVVGTTAVHAGLATQDAAGAVTAKIVLTGLTPNTSYTYQWGAYTSAAGTTGVLVAQTLTPATIVVDPI